MSREKIFLTKRQSVKVTLSPTKEIVMLLKNNSVLYRVLVSIPVRFTPYRIMAVRVGSDTRSYSILAWGV